MINRDFEYARSSVLPDWMKEFANNELKRGGNPFEDINNLFHQRNNVLAVEERVKELRKRIGLDNIKNATIRHVEKAKERGEGTTTKWCVYPKNGGKSLGCHKTRKGAEKQLQAIEINKIDDYYIQEVKDNIFGGLGDGEPDNKFDSEQLEKGIKVELEHTNNLDKAKEIAKDHLMESKDFRGSNGGKYYDKLDAMEEEFKEDLTNKKAILNRFIQIANKFEANGQIKDAMAVDELINIIAESFAKDKDVFTKYPKLQTIIDNICVSRGGFIDMPAVLHILQNEKDVKFSENDKEQLKEYINKRKNEFKKEVSDKDDFSGYVVFVINEDDGNNDIFNDLRR